MCGIAGKLFFDSGRAVDVELLRRMIDPIRHRGPDDDEVFSEGSPLGGERRARAPAADDHRSLERQAAAEQRGQLDLDRS